MKTFPIFAAATAFALVACGQDTPAENTAEALEEAAEYSTPEAAEVLENAAEQVREENITDPDAAQQALNAAGNAQTPGPPPEIQKNGQ
jgi:hypothetical protein